MPTNGIVDSEYCREYKFSVAPTVTESGDGDPVYSYHATGYTAFVPDTIQYLPGIEFDVESAFDGTSGTYSITVGMTDPGYPIIGFSSWSYTDTGATFLSPVEVAVRFYDFKIYGRELGSAMCVEWSAIKVSINGGAEVSVGSAWSGDGGGTGPNYVPFHAIPLTINATCTATRVNVPVFTRDPCDPGDGAAMSWSTHTQAPTTLSVRFKETAGGSWITLPVKVPTAPGVGSRGAPFGLSLSGIVTGTNTGNLTVNAEHLESQVRTYEGREVGTARATFRCYTVDGDLISTSVYYIANGAYDECTHELTAPYQDVYKTRSITQNIYGSVAALPNNERSIVFLGSDTRAIVQRGEVPEVVLSAGRSWNNDGTIGSTDSFVNSYPNMAALRSVVNGVSHVLFEDIFGRNIIAPASATNDKSDITTYDLAISHAVINPPPGAPDLECEGAGLWSTDDVLPDHPEVTKMESVAFEFPHEVGDLPGAQWHYEPIARYYASWPNPHWHLGYVIDARDVDGVPESWSDYWGLLREQMLDDLALPAGERRKTRNHIIGSPLENEQGNTPWLDTYFGLRWIGVSRFQVLSSTLAGTITLSSSVPGLWGARIQTGTPDCTVTTGAGGITLSSFNVSTAYVDLALAQWSNAPYLALLRAKQVTASWSATNVSSISVHLVAVDGTESAALATVSGSTFDVPRGTPSKYAGSWAYDWGDVLVTDTGTDDLASGDSATAVSSSLRASGSQLGSDQTWSSLRFKVTPTSMASPVTLNWPTFAMWATHPELLWESGKYCSLVWPNGPAIRWGTQTWYISGLGFQDPPASSPPGIANTWIDGMSYRYRVFEGSGGTLTTTLPTDLSSMFDSFEGQSIGTTDPHSHSWILPKGSGETIRIALVNSFSELPPLAVFPYRKRSTLDWAASGAHAQVVYEQVEETRKIISPERSTIVDSGGTTIGSALTAPTGWYVWGYAPALSNTETGWHVAQGSTSIATVRPWHGFYHTGGEAPSTSTAGIWNHWAPWGHYSESLADGAGIVFQQVGRPFPISRAFDTVIRVTSDPTDSRPAHWHAHDGRIHLAFNRGDDAYTTYSDSNGDDWEAPTLFMADAHDPKPFGDPIGYEGIAWWEYQSGSSGPTSIKLQVKEPKSDTYGSTIDVGIDFNDAGFSITCPADPTNAWVIVATQDGDSAPSTVVSFDQGETWAVV